MEHRCALHSHKAAALTWKILPPGGTCWSVYVTVRMCNQGFREIPEISRDFTKSLKLMSWDFMKSLNCFIT